jgi:uncharacterized protein (TIGR03382 family)
MVSGRIGSESAPVGGCATGGAGAKLGLALLLLGFVGRRRR